MSIKLNQILNLTENEIDNCKIELNMTEGESGKNKIDRWLLLNEDDKKNGNCKGISYWGWKGEQCKYQKDTLVLSFARINYDEWLLISVGRIIDVPKNSCANVSIEEKYKNFFGRLIIKLNKGNTFSGFVFWLRNMMEKHNNIEVKEILPVLYNGEIFEGYDKVNLSFEKLKDILYNKLSPTYYNALEKITGVYALTDISNGKIYIGSAYGNKGVAGRWLEYIDTKHGWNQELIKLYELDNKYFEKNFQFTLLEYFNSTYDEQKIIEREQYYKKCFSTIKNGYNAN